MSFRAIPNAVIFDKIDGSNIRVEWAGPKKGWTKFGTRNQLLDESDPVFGVVPQIFHERWGEALSRIACDERIDRGVFFFEFWGDSSFAGLHSPDDEKRLTLIDVSVHKRGIMGPHEFLKTFDGKVQTPNLISIQNWTREFVEQVWRGEPEGITFEGVVAKGGTGHDLVMAKAKTEAWIEKVRAQFDEGEAERLVNS